MADARHFDRTWQAAEPQHPAGQTYTASPEGIIWHKQSGNGVTPVRLTNFDARVTDAITYDEGLGEPETRWAMRTHLPRPRARA